MKKSRLIVEDAFTNERTRRACYLFRQVELFVNNITGNDEGISCVADGWIVEEQKLDDQLEVFKCLMLVPSDCNAYLVAARNGYYVFFAQNEVVLMDRLALDAGKAVRMALSS